MSSVFSIWTWNLKIIFNKTGQFKQKDTINVVHTVPVVLNFLPGDEFGDTSFGQQSTDNDSASNAEVSAG